MQSVLENQAITAEFPLASGLTPNSAEWWLENESGAIVQTTIAVPAEGLVTGLIRITVAGSLNATPGLRLLRLRWVEPGSIQGTGGELAYRVLPAQELVVQVNSFQTYNQALDLAGGMILVDGFIAADRDTRSRSLAEAWSRLIMLRFKEPHLTHRQDRIRDVPWAGDDLNLEDVSAIEFAALDAKLQRALRRSQIVEADHLITGGNAADQQRRTGLLSNTIGETSQMFRSGKPVEFAVSTRALRELRGYVSIAPRVGR